MKRKVSLLLFFGGLIFWCWGCGPDLDGTGNIESQAGDESAEDIAASDEEQGVIVEWTDSPEIDLIPEGPISGIANGYEFRADTVYFEPRFGKWSLVIAENELPSPLTHVPIGQNINIRLPETPQAGSVFIKEMEYGDGYFQINKKDY